jgi:hypothetical protein
MVFSVPQMLTFDLLYSYRKIHFITVSSWTYYRKLCKEVSHSLELLRFLYYNRKEEINQIEFFS